MFQSSCAKPVLCILILFAFFHFIGFGQVSTSNSSYRVTHTSTKRIFQSRHHINTRDEGIVMAGKWGVTEDDADLMITKMDVTGKILWSKNIPVNRRLDQYLLTEMSDGSIVFAGNSQVGQPPNNSDLLLIKLTCKGDIIWSKNISMGASISKRWLFLYSLKAGRDNDVIISFYNTEKNSQYAVICRVDQSGTLVWSKTFYGFDPDTNLPTVCFYSDDKIFVFGFKTFYTNFYNFDKSFFAMKLNYNTGTIEDIKGFDYSEFRLFQSVLVTHPMIHFYAEQLDDGKFVIYGEFSNFHTEGYYFKLIINKDFSINKSKVYSIPIVLGKSYSKIKVFPNGQTHIISAVHNNQKIYWYSADSLDNKIREKKIDYLATYVDLYYMLAQSGKNRASYVASTMTASTSSIEVVQVEDGDPSVSQCVGTDTSFIKILPWQAATTSTSWKAIKDNEAILTPVSIASSQIPTTTSYICMPVSGPPPANQTLKIIGPDTVCSQNSTQTYTARKQSNFQAVKWRLDNTQHQLLTTLNDSSVSISFNNSTATPQKVKLYASLVDGCDLLMDSVTIDIIPDGTRFPDSLVGCSFPLKLTPGKWFKNYLWQDGSTDSVYLPSTTGQYHVSAETFCGTTISDTVVVFSATGKNSYHQVCQGDSLTITAITGYTNYQWTPVYNLRVLSANSIRVHPNIDTFYILQALTPTGCKITDTNFVKINKLRAIDLGKDTSICPGQAISLDAGKNFLKYSWSNGISNQHLVATTAGIYHVIAIDNKGCVSKDTLTITGKDCKNGVFVPTAFTPNNDGKNDVFKPIIYANISDYEFSIYNRWGELVFKTDQINGGWEGKYRGARQSSGSFVWMLKYKLNNIAKIEKGTVMLIQ